MVSSRNLLSRGLFSGAMPVFGVCKSLIAMANFIKSSCYQVLGQVLFHDNFPFAYNAWIKWFIYHTNQNFKKNNWNPTGKLHSGRHVDPKIWKRIRISATHLWSVHFPTWWWGIYLENTSWYGTNIPIQPLIAHIDMVDIGCLFLYPNICHINIFPLRQPGCCWTHQPSATPQGRPAAPRLSAERPPPIHRSEEGHGPEKIGQRPYGFSAFHKNDAMRRKWDFIIRTHQHSFIKPHFFWHSAIQTEEITIFGRAWFSQNTGWVSLNVISIAYGLCV